MRKKVGIIKRVTCLGLVFLLSINSFAAIVSDNDGSAFITKSEFDALKSSFQSQIDSYNQSIDSKIDGAIASYLAGIKLSTVMEIKPLIDCDSSNPYKVVGSTYDTRTTPILNSFNFTSIKTHDWGGNFTRPLARFGKSYAKDSTGNPWINTEDPQYSGSTVPLSSWPQEAIAALAVYLGNWADQHENICFLRSDADPYVITKKVNEKLVFSGNLYLFENGWRGIQVAHGIAMSRKLFDDIDISTKHQIKDKFFRKLSNLTAWQSSHIIDYFEDAKSYASDGVLLPSTTPKDLYSPLASWWKDDTIRDWSGTLPTSNDFYCQTGACDVNWFTLNFALQTTNHPDALLHYSYLNCNASKIYHHAESETLMDCFTDDIADANGMKTLYAFSNKNDRLFIPLLWGATIKESEIVNFPTYDIIKWPRTKMKQGTATSTDLKDFYNGAFTYTDKTGSKKNVHFYGGFPLFVADKAYKKVTITLTEKKGTATGSSGRVWLKKGEFLNGTDLSASPWTAAERNNLYKINGTAGTSSTNYGYNISFNTATQLVINDIAAGEEVFLRFSDSSNGTGCLIDSIQIEAEIEN